MELVLAVVLGVVVGWLAGRARPATPTTESTGPGGKRLSRRQREILAALPADPPPRSIDDLMREEAADTGVDRIADAGLPLSVRLRVWHRDRDGLGDVVAERLRFAIDPGIDAATAGPDQVRLVVTAGHPADPTTHVESNTPVERHPPVRRPGSPPVVAVFGASWLDPGGADWAAARRCGQRLAEAGAVVATGGYGGVMEAVSQGAAEAGGVVVGVTAPAIFPDRPGANAWVTDERPAPTLTARLDTLFASAAAVIVLPGSIGTLTEMMVAWNAAFIARLSGVAPLPVVTVGATWTDLVATLSASLVTDGSLVSCVDTVDEAVSEVLEALALPS